jgi:hypothetical protein
MISLSSDRDLLSDLNSEERASSLGRNLELKIYRLHGHTAEGNEAVPVAIISISFQAMLYILSITIFLTSCLALDGQKPQCFPEEGCSLGSECIDGRCRPPSEIQLTLSLECLSAQACLTSMALSAQGVHDSAGGEESMSEESMNGGLEFIDAGGADSMNLPIQRGCLILEQPHQLLSLPIDLESSTLSARLFKAPTRSSVIILSSTATCPTSPKEIRERKFDRECRLEEGCLLRVRRPPIDIVDGRAFTLSFVAEQGQCFESFWSIEAPAERCDQDDNDCDGFSDEGLTCPPA